MIVYLCSGLDGLLHHCGQRCAASLLAKTKGVVAALKAYEAERLWVTAQIVQDNRVGGPERVIDLVESGRLMVLHTWTRSRATAEPNGATRWRFDR